jgi:hypothetical protein
MITIATLVILVYMYCIYKIKVASESWEKFNPFNTSNGLIFLGWFMGTAGIITFIILLFAKLAISGIIP